MIGDTHCNSRMGLCPPVFNLKDGGTYRPNKTQKYLWNSYVSFLDAVVETAKDVKPDKIGALLMGDMVDGDRKRRTHQIISRNASEVVDIAIQSLEPLYQLIDWCVFLKGTPAHVGKSGEIEEELASDCDIAQKNGENNYAWDEFYGTIGGVLFDAKHHGKLGYMRHTRTNALHTLAENLFGAYTERGEKPPRVALRGHVHLSRDTYDNHYVRAVTSPCFCGMTGYAHRVSDDLPDVGGLIFVCEGGSYQLIKKEYRLKARRPWRTSTK